MLKTHVGMKKVQMLRRLESLAPKIPKLHLCTF